MEGWVRRGHAGSEKRSSPFCRGGSEFRTVGDGNWKKLAASGESQTSSHDIATLLSKYTKALSSESLPEDRWRG